MFPTMASYSTVLNLLVSFCNVYPDEEGQSIDIYAYHPA
jgi:hypothetical protein